MPVKRCRALVYSFLFPRGRGCLRAAKLRGKFCWQHAQEKARKRSRARDDRFHSHATPLRIGRS